jgi:hypothetical protein
MKFSLIEFTNGIEKLDLYIEGINEHRGLLNQIRNLEKDSTSSTLFLKETKELLIKYFQPSNKVFEYNSIIISLYGLLESFIENLIKEYIEYLNKSIPKYSDFPSEIKNNHYEFSANLINYLKLPKYKNITTKELIVSNLYSCTNCKGKKAYEINTDAFIHHTSNFRDQSINEFFKAVGISNITSTLLHNRQFKFYIEDNGIEIEDVFKILNDLAERRNRIAHGSEETNILDINELNRYIHYMKKFTCCLNYVVFEQVIPLVIKYGDNITKIGKPIATFASKTVGIEAYKIKLAVGDIIFIEIGDGERYTLGIINSIKVKNESFQEVDATDEVKQLGISFNCNVDENCTFYLIDENTIN